jgi:hypothetical protein
LGSGLFFPFFGGCCPPSSSDKFCRFLEKTFGKFLFFSANSTNFPIFWDNFAKFSYHTKIGREKTPWFWVTLFCYFWGENLPNSPCHKIEKKKQKTKTLVLGTFLGIFFLKNSKNSPYLKIEKPNPLFWVSFPWLFMKIFVKFSISENWTTKKKISDFGYIYRNQYFIYLFNFVM